MWRSLFPREEEMNKKYEGYEVKVNFFKCRVRIIIRDCF